MTQETKDMIVLLQLEFSAEIEQADHDPKYSYRIFQRKTGNPIYQACRFSDMFRFFNIGPMQHIYITDYQRQFILIGTTSVLTNTKNVGTNANHCISWFCIYVLYRLFSALLWNVRYQIQCIG